MPAVALALLPLLAEAVALGLCLGVWLKLNIFMAMSGAVILAAVCPALIGVITQQWQYSRLGTRKGKGANSLASVFDDSTKYASTIWFGMSNLHAQLCFLAHANWLCAGMQVGFSPQQRESGQKQLQLAVWTIIRLAARMFVRCRQLTVQLDCYVTCIPIGS